MGAYGSLMADLTRPELYSSIDLHMGYLPEKAQETLKDTDLAMLAQYDFYMDCGRQDTTVGAAGTEAIHGYLESVGRDHGYDIRDGGHNSAFYMAGMAASMKMRSDHFKRAMEGVYTVTFHANGGGRTASAFTGADGRLTALPTASRSGYTFQGWYTAHQGGEQADRNRVYTKSTVLYAHWEKAESRPSGGGGGSWQTPSGVVLSPSPALPTPPPGGDASGGSFTDVPGDFWAGAEIARAAEKGIMNIWGTAPLPLAVP